jgi:hypothetical protein
MKLAVVNNFSPLYRYYEIVKYDFGLFCKSFLFSYSFMSLYAVPTVLYTDAEIQRLRSFSSKQMLKFTIL